MLFKRKWWYNENAKNSVRKQFLYLEKKLKSLLKIQGFWGRTILGTKVATAGTKNTAVYVSKGFLSLVHLSILFSTEKFLPDVQQLGLKSV